MLDHSYFDITDDIEVIIRVHPITTALAAQDSWWLEKLNAGLTTGYALGLVDDADSTGSIRAQVDSTTLDFAWESVTLTDAAGNKLLRMTYQDPVLNIDAFNFSTGVWVNQATDGAVATGAIDTNAEAIFIGTTFTGTLMEVEIRDNFGGGSYAPVSRWSFSPDTMTEDTASNPNFTGTIIDEISAGSHNLDYTIVASQTDITVTVSAVETTFTDPALTISQRFEEFVGSPFGSDIFNEPDANPNFPLASALANARDASSSPVIVFWLLLITALGAVLTVILARISKGSFAVTAFGPGAAILLGVQAFQLPIWLLALYGISSFALWLFFKYAGD